MKFLIIFICLKLVLADITSYGGNLENAMRVQVSQKLSGEMRSLVQRMRNELVINARALERAVMRENFDILQGSIANIVSTTLAVRLLPTQHYYES